MRVLQKTIMTYQELASNTPKTLAKLIEFISTKFEQEQIECWDFEQNGTQKEQHEWVKKSISLHIDLRWKEF